LKGVEEEITRFVLSKGIKAVYEERFLSQDWMIEFLLPLPCNFVINETVNWIDHRNHYEAGEESESGDSQSTCTCNRRQ
jgi:hypothetical protein